MRSPTAFGSGSPGNQARQASSRGHESLSSARAPAPTVSRPSPARRPEVALAAEVAPARRRTEQVRAQFQGDQFAMEDTVMSRFRDAKEKALRGPSS